MLLQLRPGMTKSQVRFIMGTPLIQDSFHGNRWDYVYQMREAGKVTEQRRVILDFENDLLKTVRGDVIPAGSSAPDRAEGQVNTGTRVVEPYKKPEEKSLMNKLKFWDKDDAAKAEITTEKDMVKKESDAVVKVDGVSAVITSDADASKSMLAVPLDVPITPVAEAVVTDAVIAPTEAVAEVGQTVTPITSESVVSSDIKDAVAEGVLPVVASPITDVPGNSPFYESPSGMVFDRQLRSLPEELEPETVAEIPSTRVGNKTMPTPKGLPPENEPSFFDRMLEKIGF
jgi:outer membrane protein assembly factor BamE